MAANTKPQFRGSGDEFLRRLTWPEEDRHLFTSAPWDGSFRWFRSPNVVCLEQYRRRSGSMNAERGDSSSSRGGEVNGPIVTQT
jgi:hypothetical protein